MLDKKKLDSVRNIKGFPIGNDEDIINLSNPPYYTACPNPFINNFIDKYGKKYDKETDDYHKEPFSCDISEGKNDPIYMAHGYHTKVPYKAIQKYIEHYTEKGDIVLDGFCGSGMTGLAAACSGRKAINIDLSSIATFISSNFTTYVNMIEFYDTAKNIIEKVKNKLDWIYTTEDNGYLYNVNYVVWSNVYICNSCSNEIVYWDACVNKGSKESEKYICPNCGVELDIRKLTYAYDYFNEKNNLIKNIKQVPVMIKYTKNKNQYKKDPEQYDLELLNRINGYKSRKWSPNNDIIVGDKLKETKNKSIDKINQIYTNRNRIVLEEIYYEMEKIKDKRIRNMCYFLFTSIFSRSHKMNRYMPKHNRHVGPLSGTIYFPPFSTEINIFNLLESKLEAISKINVVESSVITSLQSSTDLSNINDNTIDYIFIDPPFGDNIMYSELNYFIEGWLKVFTNNKDEAIINKTQKKTNNEYLELMGDCFDSFYRVLKPGRWITVEFHNSKNAVWNNIQEAILKSGFIVADVRILDKKKGTVNQLSYGNTVKQDLVISAYKPKDNLVKCFELENKSKETVWAFVREHLEHLPVVVIKNNQIEPITERQDYLLYDRMVAYYIMRGYSIPIDAPTFYCGLAERFIKRDDMYFLPEQVNEYDIARIKNELKPIQFELFVTNEKSAIAWLYKTLEKRQTYQELQPQFMQEIKTVDKYEIIPELLTLLEENFIKDNEGKWYIPDITKKGDIQKLREKNLLKEFKEYMESKGKLKIVRKEAIKVGFSKLWKDKNYKDIVDFSERIPESIIQEDEKLLMYYDLSLGRIE